MMIEDVKFLLQNSSCISENSFEGDVGFRASFSSNKEMSLGSYNGSTYGGVPTGGSKGGLVGGSVRSISHGSFRNGTVNKGKNLTFRTPTLTRLSTNIHPK